MPPANAQSQQGQKHGYGVARWIECHDKKKMAEFEKKYQNNLAHDAEGYLTFMTTSEYQLGFVMEEWPDIQFHKTREHNI